MALGPPSGYGSQERGSTGCAFGPRSLVFFSGLVAMDALPRGSYANRLWIHLYSRSVEAKTPLLAGDNTSL